MHKNQLGLSAALFQYILEMSESEPEILVKLREETAQHPQARMQISPEQGRLLSLLVQLINAKKTLEIGTFTGYSALCVALALPTDGQLIACDIRADYTAIAQRYWQAAGVQAKIQLHLAPALNTLDRLLAQNQANTFDFAFIDADKGNYWAYFERVLQLLRPNGLVAIDNTLWSGRVVDPEDQDKITVTLRQFNQSLIAHPGVQVVMLPIGDGLTLARKSAD